MVELAVTDRPKKTRRQIELVDEQLTSLLADARVTDHVAVLTGRYAAEHLSGTMVSDECADTSADPHTGKRT